ncbi:MAG: PAS domain S-box protein, partial [Planctomycetaceae bacterium]|nr:PAS domain S-box protein [Planctomycetaceae bacterium]
MITALWIVTGSLTLWVVFLIRRLALLRESRLTSEEQYEVIFKTVTDGLIINALDGTIVEANPAACEMHGYTREEFIGQSAAEFVHPDSLHLFSEYVEALSAGRSFHCFAQDLRKDGAIFDVEVNGVPFQFNGQPHLLGIVRDVTKRKSVEDALRQSEEINRLIVGAVPAGIVRVSLTGGILDANRRAQDFLGLSKDELTQQFVHDYDSTSIHEDGTICDTADFPVSKCLQTGKKHGPLTLGVRRPDGSIAWAMFVAIPLPDPQTHQPNGAIVTFLDITDRKKTEQKFVESEERFRLLAENVPGVIYLCQNDEGYRMIYISEAV